MRAAGRVDNGLDMHVALVLDRLDARRGGVETWTADFARALLARGHAVTVLAAGFGEAERRMGIEPVELPAMPTSWRSRTWPPPRSTAGRPGPGGAGGAGSTWSTTWASAGGATCCTRTAAAGPPPTAATANCWPRPSARCGGSRRGRCRGTGISPPSPPRSTAGRAGTAARVVALSRRVAGDLAFLDGADPAKVAVVPNGVDVRRFTPELRARHRDRTRRELSLGDGRRWP